MATAPRPGSTSRKDDVAFKITVRDEVAVVRPAEIGPRDDALVRRQTRAALGYPLSLMGALQQLADEEAIGLDSVCLLHWFGRTAAGDTTETYGEALDRFPKLTEVDDLVELTEVTPDDEEAEADPLPSAEP